MSAAIDIEIAVVGAGPAGLSAAIAARACGARVVVVDEYGKPGGQYHRQALVDSDADDSGAAREGARLVAQAREAGVEIWSNATVWAAYPGNLLAIDRAGTGVELRAKRLILATGAHDRTMPFPGWTLPGVMTPGAAQAMVKAHAVVPGQRIVVAGSGPFLLVVALALAKAGAGVEVIEAASLGVGDIARFMRFPERWSDIASLVATLATHRVPIGTRRIVTRAEGVEQLTHVVSARIDAEGRPVPGSERWHPADALAVAYGFRTQTELARLIGCRTRYDDSAGGHAVVVDHETGLTSVDDVYAAGEITGVAGHVVAVAEGTIAGASAAQSLGHRPDGAVLAAAQRRRRDAQSFADLIAMSFGPPLGLDALATPETIVCRCECVTRAAIDAAIDAGALTSSAVKRWTRCAMGQCQGRICGWPLARIVAERTGRPLAEIDNLTARLPIKPVALKALRGPNKEEQPT